MTDTIVSARKSIVNGARKVSNGAMARDADMFGQALKRWRIKRDLTQEALAHEAGITTSYASQIERGMKSPTLTVILRLCRALNCAPGDLLADFTPAVLSKLFR